MNQTEFDLMIDVLNTKNNKINKTDLLRPFKKIIIERNDGMGCSMVLEEYVTDKGQPFNNERSRCLREIKIRFDRAFGASSMWEVGYSWVPQTFGNLKTRTETDGGGIADTSCALLRAGQALKQVRFKEAVTNQNFMPISNMISRCGR